MATQPSADPTDAQPTNAPPRTFDFTPEEADPDTEFEVTVTRQWTNRYNDERLGIKTPKPWDVDPDTDPVEAKPNDVIKSLDWDTHHQSFNDDREEWEVDVSALEELQELLTDAGYAWLDERDSETERQTDDPLRQATLQAQEGEHLTATYLMKNGNGENSVEGRIHATDPDSHSIVIKRDDGYYNWIKRDNHARDPAVFSGGHSPFNGKLLRLEISPGEK